VVYDNRKGVKKKKKRKDGPRLLIKNATDIIRQNSGPDGRATEKGEKATADPLMSAVIYVSRDGEKKKGNRASP